MDFVYALNFQLDDIVTYFEIEMPVGLDRPKISDFETQLLLIFAKAGLISFSLWTAMNRALLRGGLLQ